MVKETHPLRDECIRDMLLLLAKNPFKYRTKDLVRETRKLGWAVSTAYLKFRYLKRQSLLKSRVNKQHKVIWAVSPKGQHLLFQQLNYIKNKFKPIIDVRYHLLKQPKIHKQIEYKR